MKVRVKGFFTIKEAMENQGEVWLDFDHGSLRDVLSALTKRYPDCFLERLFDPDTGAELDGVQILINGRHYRHLPRGLDTALADGDFVALFPAVAGG